MRKVEIVEDPQAQRCWVAVDEKLREPVLRVHDRDCLRGFARASTGKSCTQIVSAVEADNSRASLVYKPDFPRFRWAVLLAGLAARPSGVHVRLTLTYA
jgi:hypothetical protein